MLHGLDLFSGIGGISLALQPWVRTVCYVENEPYAQQVLRERIGDGRLDDAPIWDDARTFDPRPWRGLVDIVAGGFPCQDISTAGRGAGLAGKRSGLFFEILRIADVLRPQLIFLENVAAIFADGRGGRTVVAELATLGYDARWGVLSAFDVGAPHLRERWWCLAHAERRPVQRRGECGVLPGSPEEVGGDVSQQHATGDCGAGLADPQGERPGEARRLRRERSAQRAASGRALADAEGQPERAGLGADGTRGQRRGRPGDGGGAHLPDPGQPGLSQSERQALPRAWGRQEGGAAPECDWWAIEPDVGRVADGIPARVDRLRGLGNSVVPACAREAFQRLLCGEG